MKSFHVHALGAAVLLAAFAAGTVYSQQRPTPLQVGFLDVMKTFDGYRKCADLKEQFKQKQQSAVDELKGFAKQIEEMQNKMNMLNADSPEFAALDEQSAVLRDELDVKKKYRIHALNVEFEKRKVAIYKEICQEAQAYGSERGLAAVYLYSPPDADVAPERFDEWMDTRAVLCRDESLDVTKDVLARLNAQLPPPPVKPATPVPPSTTPPAPTQPPK